MIQINFDGKAVLVLVLESRTIRRNQDNDLLMVGLLKQREWISSGSQMFAINNPTTALLQWKQINPKGLFIGTIGAEQILVIKFQKCHEIVNNWQCSAASNKVWNTV